MTWTVTAKVDFIVFWRLTFGVQDNVLLIFSNSSCQGCMWLVFVFLGGDFEAMERMVRDEDDNRDCSPQRAKQSYSRTLEMRLMEFLVQQDFARNREHSSNPLVGQMTLYTTLLFLTFFMVWLFNLGSHWYQLHASNSCCSFPLSDGFNSSCIPSCTVCMTRVT